MVFWYGKLWSFRSCCSSLAVDIPFVAADADPHGPVCSADHGDSTVAAYFGGRCPCCAGRADSQVLPWRRPWRSHSCSLLRNQTPSTTLRIWQSLVRRFAFGVQDSGLLGDDIRNVPVFSACWFNTGYMYTSVYEAFGRFSHVLVPRISSQCLVRQRILAQSDHGGFYGSDSRKLRKFRSCRVSRS